MLGPGTTFGRYELLRSVARGGMGEVWAARLTGAHGFERLVALKTISAEEGDSGATLRDMFIDEARTAAMIRHDNVVPVIDCGEEHGRLYLVTDWVEGEPLTSFANLAQNGHPVPLPIALKLIGDVLRGLYAAHSQVGKDGVCLGIIHRDVSPPNVMVADAGVAKVLDFGIARSRDRISRSVAGEVRGKLHYLAPELIAGGVATPGVDLWATGLLLHLLLTGNQPFADLDANMIGQRLLSPEEIPLKTDPTSPVTALLRRALQKDPAARYSSADEMKQDIERVARSLGLVATADDVAAFMQWRFAVSIRARTRRTERAAAMPSRTPPTSASPLAAPVVHRTNTPDLVPNLVSDRVAQNAPELELPRASNRPPGSPSRRPSTPRMSKVPPKNSRPPAPSLHVSLNSKSSGPAARMVQTMAPAKPSRDNPGRMLAGIIGLILALLIVIAAFTRLRHWSDQPAPENELPPIPGVGPIPAPSNH